MLNGINNTVISDFGITALGFITYSSGWLWNWNNAFSSGISPALIDSNVKKEESLPASLVLFSVMCFNSM